MTKGKPVSIPTTVEAQIRTRARNLPVHKCYINKDWEESQLATIIVVRKHTNGNITMGNFLVDLKLLGVKDCIYRFNESTLRMDEILENRDDLLEECDYTLAHNIIYAGLEFADDYGFAPHRNFKTAQYILEEDSDNIPMIDVPLGDEGIPVLEVPYGETGQREMAILDKTTGGDFRVVFFDKTGKPKPMERTYAEVFEEVMETGFDSYWEKYLQSSSAREIQVMTDLVHLIRVYTNEEKDWIDIEFDRIIKDPRIIMKPDPPVNSYEEELVPAIERFSAGDIEKASVEFRKVINQHPDEPLLWDIFLYNLSIDSDSVDKETVEQAYSRFPGHPVIKAWYAEWLAQEGHIDEMFALFGDAPGLDALTTENTFISLNALTSFCYACAAAWLSKEDVLHAEPYYQIIVRLGLDYRLSEYIQWTMIDLKRTQLKELLAGVIDSDEEPAADQSSQ
ncbi:MAG: hypothetical protein LBL24_08615 [Bacteroidales bacterium]|jgi:hypothetical protein|nr:hypothetical protein [Bacteroidales bacterium]